MRGVRSKANSAKTDSDAWWGPVLRLERPIVVLCSMPPVERIQLVRDGFPAAVLGVLARAMGVETQMLVALLQFPRATANRARRRTARLSRHQSESVIGLIRLIREVELIVHESGDPAGFESARWVASWLDQPLPALGGRRPATFMDTVDGREIVSGLVAQMQSGAYA